MQLLGRWRGFAIPFVASALGFLTSADAPGDFTNELTAPAASGGWSSNSTYRSFHVLGHGVSPEEVATNADFAAWSGGLSGAVLDPGADRDGDGIIDENDLNDDSDGLPDAVELAGTAFDPGTPTDPWRADSDDDGFDDRQESIAGTNPQDAGSGLHLLSMTAADDVPLVGWRGRRDRRYLVLAGTSVTGLVAHPSLVSTVTAVGGSAPWYETETIFTNPVPTLHEFYRVRVLEE
jgi:hypothetical protein